MTTPGPNQIYKCPNCNDFITICTLGSYNTFGGVLIWTDGKTESPDFFESEKISKCANCEKCFWVSEAEYIGEYDCLDCLNGDEEIPEEWEKAPFINSLDSRDYQEALEKCLYTTRNQEKYLRIQLWWLLNDIIRSDSSRDFKSSLNHLFDGNLKSLKKLLDKNDFDEAIMLAEVEREIGEFENCIDLINELENLVSEEYQEEICKLLLELATKKESKVHLFKE